MPAIPAGDRGATPLPTAIYLKQIKLKHMSTAKKGAEAPAKKAVGNKNTEILLGKAAVGIATSYKGLQTFMNEFANLENRIPECTLEISNLEDQIGGLKNELENSKNQNKLELELQFKADRASFANVYLAENNLVSISKAELDKLRTDLMKATTEQDKAVNAAVGAVTAKLTAEAKAATTIAEMQHKTNEATNLAKIAQMEDKIIFLTEQVEMWKGALDSEREAGVKRAQASSIQNLNVGNGNGK